MFDFKIDENIAKKEVDLKEIYDVLIIGGGPAAINAAIYSARNNLSTLLVSKVVGGQLLNTNEIDNYLGFYDVSGEYLSDKFNEHLKRFDVDILLDTEVLNIKKVDELLFLTNLTNKEIKSKTVIISTGGSPRLLNVKGEKELTGRGISYCVICDGAFYNNKDIVVVGGGNSALEAALDLSNIANSVHIVQNLSSFSADSILVDKVKNAKNITYQFNSLVTEIIGDEKVEALKIENLEGSTIMDADGVFIQIGIIPNTKFIKDLVLLNEALEIITNNIQETSVKGIYAAGDVTNYPYKQVITAASQGAVSALSANNYIKRGE